MKLPGILTTITAALLSAGCGLWAAPLPDSHTSPRALAEALLDAVADRDSPALRRLALTEEEFRRFVWPDLPAARPERNLPFSYVWGDLHQKSEASLGRTLATHGGIRYRFEALRYLGTSTPYKSYVVHRKALVTVRAPDGTARELRLFGSVLEKRGQLKIFSYVVD